MMANVVATDKVVNIKKYVTGHICMASTYKYKGWYFESSHYQYWPLKKDGEPRLRAGDKFWSVLAEFLDLSEESQEEFRTGGGCIEI